MEPLTHREQDILELLAEGLTSSKMAERLTLAVSTVRWYVQHIYGKLDVNGKRQAISRAREMGLLPATPNLLSENRPHASEPRPRHNLPPELSSFIGREEAITQLMRLVRDYPLVTVTGVGGTGKTRLALKTAEKALLLSPPPFPDGVWLVELAPIANGELVSQEVIAAIGLSDVPGLSSTAKLIDFLRNRRILILLDNCEHVIDASSRLARDLLQGCPGVHILATSREILGVVGEASYRCPSLTLPDPRDSQNEKNLARSEAVRLFVERAQRVSLEFSLTEDYAPWVIQICRRLDGIPLAIELAAARLRLLSVDQIAARLDNVFHLLTGGYRTDLPRHQTLKALFDWSYNLLSQKERLLLLRLSVFSGGWTLEAAEAVCANSSDGKGLLTTGEIMDLLGQLLDKSLVEMAPRPKASDLRYRMLEPMRQYVRVQIGLNSAVEYNDIEKLRDRHLNYFLSLAVQVEPHLRGKDQRSWQERLDGDLENFRLALEWAEEHNIEKGLALATALEVFWFVCNHGVEGIAHLERLLTLESSAAVDGTTPGTPMRTVERSIFRGKALNSCGSLKALFDEIEKASPLLEEARDIFQAQGDRCRIDYAKALLYLSKIEQEDLYQALTIAHQALEVLVDEESGYWAAECSIYLSVIYWVKGNLEDASTFAHKCLAWSRESGDVDEEGAALHNLAWIELSRGNPDQAMLLYTAAWACFDASGNRRLTSVILNGKSTVALSKGEYRQAIELCEEALAIAKDFNDKTIEMDAIFNLAWAAWSLKDYDLAIQQLQRTSITDSVNRTILGISQEYILGQVSISRGEYAQASAYLKAYIDSYDITYLPFGFRKFSKWNALTSVGVLAIAQCQATCTAMLLGAQDALFDSWVLSLRPLAERQAYEQALADARDMLGEQAFTIAWQEGQALNIDQAMHYALTYLQSE